MIVKAKTTRGRASDSDIVACRRGLFRRMVPLVTTAVIFHLALTVDDLDEAVAFYGDALGCAMGRRAPTWVDVNFFGHQLSLHLGSRAVRRAGEVDGVEVPMPHFGVVLDLLRWRALASRLEAMGATFVIEPQSRFVDEPHEQATFFVADPAGNHLEFKGTGDGVDLLAAPA